jgi:dynein heavy chain
VVVRFERIDLEHQRIALIKQVILNANKISSDLTQLKNFEQTILLQISEAGSAILENDKLVNTLDNTREMSIVIKERMVVAEKTTESINLAREGYRDIANRASNMYFVIADLSFVNHMYRWSLEYFI